MKPQNRTYREDQLDSMGDIALTTNTHRYNHTGEKTEILKTDDWYRAVDLSSLHRFANELAQTEGDFFYASPLQSGLWKVAYQQTAAKDFITNMSIDFDSLRWQYRHHVHSPIFTAFECVARELPDHWIEYFNSQHPRGTIDQIVQRFNLAAESLRAKLRSKASRTKYSDFRRNAQKRFHAIIDYFHRCMTKRSNLTIVRLDLHPSKEVATIPDGCEHLSDEQIKEIRRLRDAFSRHVKRHFKTSLVGYLGKIEIGTDRGFHLHFIVMLDAARHQQDVSIAAALGDEWTRNIAKGTSSYFNCNKKKNYYKYPAIGRVNTNSKETILGLRFLAAYLSLSELYVKAKLPESFRSLCKGVPPTSTNTKGGRPSAHKPDFDIRTFNMKEVIRQIAFI